eukprot:TRINITY_DN17243_c0_g1_i1.p1 TRINITY_DN17243_c0_g1~~TRINITY_DN17243_c0_g1_i1.p1  ORF type:complete len:401 (+),score=56.80 TRINITY_DN17243_c0_g1_i1:42-1205(+)
MGPLMLIAFGTGGIKPCVSAHGADQYLPTQEKQRENFFAMFYFSINSGALFANIFMPTIKDYVSCFGSQCYTLAFGIPTIVFLVALIVFFAGKKYYRIVPPMGAFLPLKAVKVMGYAFLKCVRASDVERSQAGGWKKWLSFAENEYGRSFVEEVRMFGSVVVVIAPFILCWMIHDQYSSEWIYQFGHMDRKIGGYEVSTEVNGAINTLLVITLLPILVNFVYPNMPRLTSLRKMGLGYFLIIISFVVAGFLDYRVEELYDAAPYLEQDGILTDEKDCSTCVSGVWQIPQFFLLTLGEVMVYATGLNFVYHEVGTQMKAMSMSFWLITISLGSLAIVSVEESLVYAGIHGPIKYFVYSGLGSVGLVIFVVLAQFWFVSIDEQEGDLLD